MFREIRTIVWRSHTFGLERIWLDTFVFLPQTDVLFPQYLLVLSFFFLRSRFVCHCFALGKQYIRSNFDVSFPLNYPLCYSGLSYSSLGLVWIVFHISTTASSEPAAVG